MNNSSSDNSEGNSPTAEMAFRGIAQAVIEDLPSLPSLVFKEHILQPLLDGDRERLMENWRGCAESLQRPIRIVDEQGKQIAIAPSLIAPMQTQFSRAGNESLADVFDTARLKAAISPRMADGYIDDRWKERDFKPENPYHVLLQWNQLAVLVGSDKIPFPDIKRAASNTAAPESTATTPLPFSEQFDEF